MRQCVLDTETTGLSPSDGHRIIEIGVVELVDRQLTGRDFHVYINPERDIDESAIKVHGITDEFLSDKPIFSEINQAFLEFIEGSELLIHNAPFDVGFIEYEWQCMGLERTMPQVADVTDTLLMARKQFPGQKNNLDALCKRLGIDLNKRSLHGALLDAELLAQVYLLMTSSQTELFASSEASASAAKAIGGKHSAPIKLVKMTLTDDEVAAHQKWMQRMQEKINA